jgi:hypothetical protein
MDVFSLREAIVGDYARFTRSFTKVGAPDIRASLDREYERGRFWPAPLIQLNPSFVPGVTVQELVREGVLHEECGRIFRIGKDQGGPGEDSYRPSWAQLCADHRDRLGQEPELLHPDRR